MMTSTRLTVIPPLPSPATSRSSARAAILTRDSFPTQDRRLGARVHNPLIQPLKSPPQAVDKARGWAGRVGASDAPRRPNREGRMERMQAEQIAMSQLDGGERLLWSGTPAPGAAARRALPAVLVGIPFTAFAAFWIIMASGITKGVPRT